MSRVETQSDASSHTKKCKSGPVRSDGQTETQVDDAEDAATKVFLSPLPAFQPGPIFEAYWVKAKR